jgi:hypothetical protein
MMDQVVPLVGKMHSVHRQKSLPVGSRSTWLGGLTVVWQDRYKGTLHAAGAKKKEAKKNYDGTG